MTFPIIKNQHYNSLTCSDKVLVLEYSLRRMASAAMGTEAKWTEFQLNTWIDKYMKELYNDCSPNKLTGSALNTQTV